MKDYEPLTREHAEALLATAGVEGEEMIKRAIEEAMANPGVKNPAVTVN